MASANNQHFLCSFSTEKLWSLNANGDRSHPTASPAPCSPLNSPDLGSGNRQPCTYLACSNLRHKCPPARPERAFSHLDNGTFSGYGFFSLVVGISNSPVACVAAAVTEIPDHPEPTAAGATAFIVAKVKFGPHGRAKLYFGGESWEVKLKMQ